MSEKIGVLYLHDKCNISGGERSLLNLWKNLDQSQFALYLIIPEEGTFSDHAGKIGINVSYLKVPKLNIINIFSILYVTLNLLIFIMGNRIKIIHSCAPRNNIISAFIGKLFHVKVIWHERNLLLEGEEDISNKHIHLPDRIICNSKAVADRFCNNNAMPEKVAVIYNGVDIVEFNPLKDIDEAKQECGLKGKRIVGIVTNLDSRKRVEYFIDAAFFILKNTPDVFFMIVGGEFASTDGSRMKELKRKLNKLDLKDHLIFTGFQDDVTPYVSAFDVSVHVTRKEACSRAILESMSCAKAVVAMDDGGNPELIENGVSGILVAPDDMNGFIDAIESLLDDEDKRIETGKKARLRVEKYFDVKRNTEETQNLYLELLS